MERLERFYRIQQLLKSRRYVRTQEFLDALEISRATFKRDLDYLPHHLVKEAYLLHSGPEHDRPCWDESSVLWAVYPERGFFGFSEPGRVKVLDDGSLQEQPLVEARVRGTIGNTLRALAGGAQASAQLIPQVLDLLAQASLGLADLQAIVFGRGPGSFTGLRTACAVAQGLAFGANVPVLPIDTLLAVAEDARLRSAEPASPMTVLAVLDARMDEVYTAALDWDGQHWQVAQAWQVCAPEQVQPSPGRVLAGNALPTYAGRLPDAPYIAARPCALAMLRLAPALWAAGQAVPADQAMPLYVRDKVAKTTLEREAEKAAAR